MPTDIEAHIIADCGEGRVDGEDCDGIKANQQVDFKVQLTLPDSEKMDQEKCEKLKKELAENEINFKVYGMSGNNGVGIHLDLECNCNCQESEPDLKINDVHLQEKFGTDTFECQNGGNFTCGVCECPAGYREMSKNLFFCCFLIIFCEKQ